MTKLRAKLEREGDACSIPEVIPAPGLYRYAPKVDIRQPLPGRPRRWLGMLMRTTLPAVSVLLLLAIVLVVGNIFSGIGTPGRNGDITGRAQVIDPDTIEIHGRRIRLFGVHAPEAEQLCSLDDKSYRCGREAASALAGKIGHRAVRCQQRDVDPYTRIVAMCYLGNEHLNKWLVSQRLKRIASSFGRA